MKTYLNYNHICPNQFFEETEVNTVKTKNVNNILVLIFDKTCTVHYRYAFKVMKKSILMVMPSWQQKYHTLNIFVPLKIPAKGSYFHLISGMYEHRETH